MDAKQLNDNLVDYLYGELAPDDVAAFEQGLKQHPEIQEQLDQLEQTRSFVSQLESVDPPADINKRLVAAAIARVPQKQNKESFAQRLRNMLRIAVLAPAVSAAAMIVVVVGLSLYVYRLGAPTDGPMDRRAIAEQEMQPAVAPQSESVGAGDESASVKNVHKHVKDDLQIAQDQATQQKNEVLEEKGTSSKAPAYRLSTQGDMPARKQELRKARDWSTHRQRARQKAKRRARVSTRATRSNRRIRSRKAIGEPSLRYDTAPLGGLAATRGASEGSAGSSLGSEALGASKRSSARRGGAKTGIARPEITEADRNRYEDEASAPKAAAAAPDDDKQVDRIERSFAQPPPARKRPTQALAGKATSRDMREAKRPRPAKPSAERSDLFAEPSAPVANKEKMNSAARRKRALRLINDGSAAVAKRNCKSALVFFDRALIVDAKLASLVEQRLGRCAVTLAQAERSYPVLTTQMRKLRMARAAKRARPSAPAAAPQRKSNAKQ